MAFQSDDVGGRCLYPRVAATTLKVSPKILDQLGDSGGAHSLIGSLYCRGHSLPGGVAAAIVRQRGTYVRGIKSCVWYCCCKILYPPLADRTFLLPDIMFGLHAMSLIHPQDLFVQHILSNMKKQ